MIRLKEKIKTWLGPLWWYAAIIFCVQRFGDVINAFVGVWLVPRYVPQDELGAVLPLIQVGSVLGLPLTILIVPFTKFLNAYATRGEYGKVKRLLLDMFMFAGFLFLGIMICTQFAMPFVFERMRVAEGSLPLLIIASGVVGALSSVFVNALQALKQFGLVAFANLLVAPVRLVTMLVCMPIRAISGFFAGQTAPSVMLIVVSLFGLRGRLGKSVRAEPYWRMDGRPIMRYTVLVAAALFFSLMQTLVESFVVRHRLSDMDSAGFYVLSRFAEMGAYSGMTFSIVLFPLAAERHERGEGTRALLWQTLMGVFILGGALVCVFHFFGRQLLGLSPVWSPYTGYATQLTLLAAVYVLRAGIQCFINYEMACGRFKFVSYLGLIAVGECVLLYGLTGYGFFEGLLPEKWVEWMASVQAAQLDFVLRCMLWAVALSVAGVGAHLAVRSRRGCHF